MQAPVLKALSLTGSPRADWIALRLLCNRIDMWADQQLYWTKALPLTAEKHLLAASCPKQSPVQCCAVKAVAADLREQVPGP